MDKTNTPKSSLQSNIQKSPKLLMNNKISEGTSMIEKSPELCKVQRISIRSVSDSNLNKNLDREIGPSRKARSASINDLQSITESSEPLDSLEYIMTPKLDSPSFRHVKTNISSMHATNDCTYSPSPSKLEEIICSTPANYLSSRQSMSPITKSTKRMPKSMQVIIILKKR